VLPALRLAIHDPDPADPDAPGPVRPTARATLRPVSGQPGRFTVEASGGGAFLVIDGRGRAGEAPCGPSVIPVRALPGYPRRAARPPEFTIAVPTCQATWAGMIEIPAGPFIEGGPGEPVSAEQVEYEQVERVTELPSFRIDQTEVTNAAYGMLDGQANPHPRRNLPWGTKLLPGMASVVVGRPTQAAAVGAFPTDRSPYGVLDLAGNVSEWTSTFNTIGMPYTRGGNWSETSAESLVEFVAIENQQPPFDVAGVRGARCAL
jgi:formylglycine-generating enzyme required for sulfatase activity